jgi:hypothetical protein
MRWTILSSALVALLSFSNARAENIEYRFKGDLLQAAGEQLSEDGNCVVYEYWMVGGYDQRTKTDNSGYTEDPTLNVIAQKIRACWIESECGAYQEIEFLTSLEGSVPMPASAMNVDRDLGWATLDATADLVDSVTGQSRTLRVRVDAAGVGEAVRGSYNSVDSSWYGSQHVRIRGITRGAEGSVSILDQDGVELANGPAFFFGIGRAQEANVLFPNP